MWHVDGSVCERAHIEWRTSLSHLCHDLASHLATTLYSSCHAAVRHDEESLNRSGDLPHVAVPTHISHNIPDCPRRVLQVMSPQESLQAYRRFILSCILFFVKRRLHKQTVCSTVCYSFELQVIVSWSGCHV